MKAIVNFISEIPVMRASAAFSVIALVVVLLAWLLKPLLVPLVISFALYALLDPLSKKMNRSGLSSTQAAMVVLLGLIVLSGVGGFLLFSHADDYLQALSDKVNLLYQELSQIANHLDSKTSNMGLATQFSSYFQNDTDTTSVDADTLLAGSNVMLSLVASLVLVPLFTFFMVKDFRQMRNLLLGMLPNRHFELGWLIYYRVACQLQDYIRGIIIQISIMSLVCALGFWLVGFSSPVLLGLMAGMLALIPYVGPILGVIPPVLVSLGSPDFGPITFVSAVGVILVANTIDNLIVVPTVIAHAVNLHPLLVIVGVILFGNAFGALGMILAIPIMATSNIVFNGLKRGLRYEFE